MSLLWVCGQEMWARNVPVMWQLSIAAPLGLFFPVTFTLRQVHVSDTQTFPVHSSLFSLEWFLLAVVIPFFCTLTLWSRGESLLCLSVLSHPFTCCRRQHLFLLCSATFSMNSYSQKCSSLALRGIISRFPFFPFSYPVQLHLTPAIINLVRRIFPVVLLSSLSIQLFFFLFVH